MTSEPKSTVEPFRGRIAFVGAGAVGGFYGGKLARAGADVAFLLRRDLASWSERGLRVRSVDGDFTVQPVQAFASPTEIGPLDLVVITLKATANPAMDSLVPPLLHDGTRILTLQNGLANDAWLARRFGPERIYGGLCFVCINRDADGVVHHLGQGHVNLGKYQGPPDAFVESVAALFSRAGIPAKVVPDLAAAQWRKLVWNVPFNGLAVAGGGIDCAEILATPAGEARARALMAEVIGAASRLGYAMPGNLIDQQIAVTRAMGDYRPSTLIDYLAGQPVELEAIWGEPLRQARAAGETMTELARLYDEIRARVEGKTAGA